MSQFHAKFEWNHPYFAVILSKWAKHHRTEQCDSLINGIDKPYREYIARQCEGCRIPAYTYLLGMLSCCDAACVMPLFCDFV